MQLNKYNVINFKFNLFKAQFNLECLYVSSDIPLRSLIVCFPRETAEVTGTEPGTGYNVKMAREVEEVKTGL